MAVHRKKRAMSIWVSVENRDLVRRLAKELGIPQSTVFALAIRQFSKKAARVELEGVRG